MKITRTLAYNPIEPAPLSLRVPSGLPLTLDLQYLDIIGRPLSDDIAAQLQLTSRTTSQTTYHAAPASDIVNGKARVTIGEDVLTDVNGYRLRLTGTYKQEPVLFALGQLRIVESAGPEAVPKDVIDDVPLTLSYNFDASISVRLWQDATKGTPFDLTSATISASIYPNSSTPAPLYDFTVTPTMIPGEVLLGLTYDKVNTLPSLCWWALRASTAGGVTTLCAGTITISGVRPS